MHPVVEFVMNRITRMVNSRWRFSKIREHLRDSVNVNRIALRFGDHPDFVRAVVEQEIVALLTIGAAVNVVLSGKLGTRSSLKALAARASDHYGDTITPATACFYRIAYRKAHKLAEDCRTYGTQHKRDMRRRDYETTRQRVKAR